MVTEKKQEAPDAPGRKPKQELPEIVSHSNPEPIRQPSLHPEKPKNFDAPENKSIIPPLPKPDSKVIKKPITEKDNKGKRYDNSEQYDSFIKAHATDVTNTNFASFEFARMEDAQQAFLQAKELFALATDTGKVIALKDIDFGIIEASPLSAQPKIVAFYYSKALTLSEYNKLKGTFESCKGKYLKSIDMLPAEMEPPPFTSGTQARLPPNQKQALPSGAPPTVVEKAKKPAPTSGTASVIAEKNKKPAPGEAKAAPALLAEEVIFLREEKIENGVCKIYQAKSKAAAMKFLDATVIQNKGFCIEIDTPAGTIGKDAEGIYQP